ncbi:hypothetical protein J4461_04050 [Candidatus Pacearchaeota archaeon]|nr:hypothetical protein [Candidatus Pacearchaeota archaeon]
MAQIDETATMQRPNEEISCSSLVLGLIILKPGRPSFKSNDFKERLKRVADRHNLERMFKGYSAGDGTSLLERTSGFDNAIQLAQGVRLIYQEGNMLNTDIYRINERAKPSVEQCLVSQYGGDFLSNLVPLSDLVWSSPP